MDALSVHAICIAAYAYCRDLKPANILVFQPLLSRPVFKLGDFGYSKSTDARGRLKSVLGTASYGAPEVHCRCRHDVCY